VPSENSKTRFKTSNSASAKVRLNMD